MPGDSNSTSLAAESCSSGIETRSASIESVNDSDTPIRLLRSSKRQTTEVIKLTNKRTRQIIDEAITSESASVDSRESSCEQSECASDTECCVQLTSSCVSKQSNKLGRANFFHLTSKEHVCRSCFDEMARTGRNVNEQYISWKQRWLQQSRCAPTLRIFALDMLLPFWISCNECGKFRKTSTDENEWTNEDIANFTCAQLYNNTNKPCSVEEDKKVASAHELTWILTASAPTFLHNSPALQFLADEYFVDEIGISPSLTKPAQTTLPDAKASFMIPFNVPNNASVAFCICPDAMENDELESFPEFSSEPMPYFGLRNLIVALWALNPFEYLTFDKCLHHLLCRGLARVWYCGQLKRIYEYLCIKNIINYGILPLTSHKIIKEKVRKTLEVIVIGGGISGISTARQLQMKGAKVTILEAKECCGGRMKDDNSLGVAVGCGAQLITGITNNPIILMCEQIGVEYRRLSDECPLLDAQNGQIISPSSDRVVDEHFNCVLDAIGEWRKVTGTGDSSLLEKINGFHRTFMGAIDFPWSKDYDRILNWQIGNIEFSCGSRLSEVSARNWDQNEALGQFAGDHCLLSVGSNRIISGLASGLDVRHNHPVNRIEYGKKGKKAIVFCENGKKFTCDKVVLCLPLAVYQKKLVEFSPPLPSKKLDAFKYLGAGLIEKVAVSFPSRFWSSMLKKDGTLDYFGHIPKNGKDRGLFNIFYDFSSRNNKNSKFVLMSYVCGDSVTLVNKMSKTEIVDLFVDTLRDLFPNEEIPNPIGSIVTSWKNDRYIGMSYSYVKINGTGEQYDNMAEPVNDQLYFAGECTNRFFPQTMTGAYVSGLREASRIAESFILENSRP